MAVPNHEKVLDAYLYKTILCVFDNVRFIGLPYGHDLRFVHDKVLVQIDIKSTGPNDNPNEVVSSPNQVSGDSISFDGDGILNSTVQVEGSLRKMKFQPELPPFYILDEKPVLTLSFYLKFPIFFLDSPFNLTILNSNDNFS